MLPDADMPLSRAGLMILRYAVGPKTTSHLVKEGGLTVCGLRPVGARWKMGHKFDPSQDCQRCAKTFRHGLARLLTYCPKCASDLELQIELLPNRRCANCGNLWS